MNAKSGKKHKVKGSRFDNDLDMTSNGAATELGDKNMLGLGKILDEKSRDKFGLQAETFRLENVNSSRQTKQQLVSYDERDATKMAINSPKESNRTEEAFRQPIPIKRVGLEIQEYTQEGSQPSLVGEGGSMQNLRSLGSMKEQQSEAHIGQRSRNDAMTASDSNIIAGAQIMSPTDIVFLQANSQ